MQKKLLVAITLVLLMPVSAWTQQKGSIELKSVAEVEVTETNAKGEKEIKRVDIAKAKVVPGDVVVFSTYYTNISNKPAEKVMITNPVPEHMLYLDRSAEGKGTAMEFSVNGGKSYNTPDKLSVTDASGKARKAVASDYTHIKWTVIKPVAPGGKGDVFFKAKLK
jgi:uncharacterized repeat protein (TIGR01451 family)